MNRTVVTMAEVLLGMFVLACTTAFAQDDPQSMVETQSTVKIGVYRDLGFLRKVKLGTAPYVNPRLLDTAATGYRYNPDDLTERVNCEQQDEIYSAVVEGKIMFANGRQGGEFEVIAPDNPQLRNQIDTCERFSTWANQLERETAAFISVYSRFGEASGAPVVAWVAEPWARQAGQ